MDSLISLVQWVGESHRRALVITRSPSGRWQITISEAGDGQGHGYGSTPDAAAQEAIDDYDIAFRRTTSPAPRYARTEDDPLPRMRSVGTADQVPILP